MNALTWLDSTSATVTRGLEAKPHVRWMIRRDTDEILEISQSTDAPLDAESLQATLRQRHVIGMVVEVGEKVVGFMIYELHKTRLHITHLAVHPLWQRVGVGSVMVSRLAGKVAENHRRNRLTLDVGERNVTGQIWLRGRGFLAVRCDSEAETIRFVRRVEHVVE